jgi:hypothetical protein
MSRNPVKLKVNPGPFSPFSAPVLTLEVQDGMRSGGLNRSWGMIMDSAGDAVCWTGLDLTGKTQASLLYSNGEGSGDSVDVRLNTVTIGTFGTANCTTNGAWEGQCNTVSTTFTQQPGEGTLCLVGAGPGWIAAVNRVTVQ